MKKPYLPEQLPDAGQSSCSQAEVLLLTAKVKLSQDVILAQGFVRNCLGVRD